jgi:hypothetical protein
MKARKELAKGHYEGDYVVVRTSAQDKPLKTAVVKLRGSDSKDQLFGRLEKDAHLKPTTSTFLTTDILINLGRDPYPGSVYGADLKSLYRKTLQHDKFGDIHFFTKPSKETLESFWQSLDATYFLLEKFNLTELLSLPICFEVHPQESMGRYTGYFKPSRDPEKSPHRITISVGEHSLEHASIATWTYILLHELGHAAHLTQLIASPEAMAAWVSLYTRTVIDENIHDQDLKRLQKSFLKSEATVADFASTLEEDDAESFRKILGWIKKIRGVSVGDLNQLVRTRKVEDVQYVWPTKSVTSPKLIPAVTEYACKNPKELFAETFAFVLSSHKVPKELATLMEKSLRFVRIQLKGSTE